DSGAVDLVLQIEAPPSVAAGIQRVGRAGHSVGEISRGVVIPKFRGDLLESAAVVEGMLEGRIESTAVPRRPLDVLAQQIVAMCALGEWDVETLGRVIRRAYPYSDLGPRAFESVLDMLSGRYPSDQFVELRPRLVWDRVAGKVRGRAGFDDLAIKNLLKYLDDQAAATGAVPDDRTLLVERFRDEVGDWRVCLHTPFGGRVHAPLALALESHLQQTLGVDARALWTDDGIAMHLPEVES